MSIDVDRDGAVTTITMNRPERKNAMDLEHFRDLTNAWIDFRDDDSQRVAIITGAGETFCVGADLKEFIPLVTGHPDLRPETDIPLDVGTKAVLREFELSKPVIAAVNGMCVAGGMEMLMGTDLRIASTHASFGIYEPKRGLFPGGGTTVRLPRQIPFVYAMEILLCCDAVDAEAAHRMGIVNEVVTPAELLPTARRYAERIIANAPLAIEAVKRSVLTNMSLPLGEAYAVEEEIGREVFKTEDAKEGPRAFAEKRAPVWRRR